MFNLQGCSVKYKDESSCIFDICWVVSMRCEMTQVKSMQILRVDELTARLILSFPGLQRPVKFSFEYSTSRSNRSKEGKVFFVLFAHFSN